MNINEAIQTVAKATGQTEEQLRKKLQQLAGKEVMECAGQVGMQGMAGFRGPNQISFSPSMSNEELYEWILRNKFNERR